MNLTQRRIYEKQMLHVINEIKNGNFTCLTMLSSNDGFTSVKALELFYQKIPSDMKYRIVMNIYNNFKGDTIRLNRYMRDIVNYRPGNYLCGIPPKVREEDVLTVYRAGVKHILKAPYTLSWTLDYNVANWFYERALLFNLPSNLYKGQIYKTDIIAYTNRRNEQEILQYGNMRNIEKIRGD